LETKVVKYKWNKLSHFILCLTSFSNIQVGRIRPSDYPEELDEFMDRTFAFRVKWQPGWGSGQASVLECRDSPELVKKILEQLPNAEV
jgi:hypothetical protein